MLSMFEPRDSTRECVLEHRAQRDLLTTHRIGFELDSSVESYGILITLETVLVTGLKRHSARPKDSASDSQRAANIMLKSPALAKPNEDELQRIGVHF